MRRAVRSILSLSFLFVLVLGVVAWADDPPTLKPWEGKWLSSAKCLEYPEVQPCLAKIAEAAGGKTTEKDVARFLQDMYKASFGAMEVKGQNITFYQEDGVSPLGTYEYRVAGVEEVAFGEHTVRWYKIETSDHKAGEFKHLIATEVHAHGEKSLAHWHMRYGSEDFNTLMNDKPAMWWPTLIAYDTPKDTIVQNYETNVEAFASFMPKKK